MAYTTIKKPSDYFNTKLYTGNSSTQSITGVGFQPDWVWLKSRSDATNHGLHDVLRVIGSAEAMLSSNTTSAETTGGAYISSFDTDGFTLNSNTSGNGSGQTYASWNWKANGAGSSNTDGSITSSVSANTTSGFSIVSYTGTGANATIGHGLNAECKMVIIKNRTDVVDWSVNHQPLNASLGDYTRYLTLNASSTVSGAGNVQYQNTAFTSSVFNVGTSNTTNGSGDNMIAYCFAEKKGFSKFGLYTGNGSTDGPFVYTGFKPAFVLIKRTDSIGTWYIYDNKRDSFNVMTKNVFPNLNNAEDDNSTNNNTDFLSNGFKIRTVSGARNTSGGSHIYMAFAEEPLVGDNPATAR